MTSINITDLEFLASCEQSSDASGGSYTWASASTSVGPGIAFADISAIAIGQQTYTSGKTITNVFNTSYSQSSHALATVTAIARTDNSYSRTTVYSSSDFYSLW